MDAVIATVVTAPRAVDNDHDIAILESMLSYAAFHDMKYADLQLHTKFSDGMESPEELMIRAKGEGISCIAITDHDTTAAFPDAFATADKIGIEVIPGIEISCDIPKGELHILGYFIDVTHTAFQNTLQYFRKNRQERIGKIVSALQNDGIDITEDDVMREVKGNSPGRPHIARAMVRKGIVQTVQEAFNRYIGNGHAACVNKTKMRPHEAIDLIHLAGGLAIVAHPHSLDALDTLRVLVQYGLDGVEVFYPEHRASFIQELEKIIEKHRLLATGGSDCHGPGKKTSRMGRIKLPYEYVEKMKKIHQQKYD